MSTPQPQIFYNPFTNNFDYADTSGGSGGGGSGGVVNWIDVIGTSQDVAINTGYTCNNIGLVTLTLPSICPYGSYFRIVGKGLGGWKISQNAGQVIHFGNDDTTIGATGYIASQQQYDCIEILCSAANTDFTVIAGPQGNLTII